jgi:hypothetical protein
MGCRPSSFEARKRSHLRMTETYGIQIRTAEYRRFEPRGFRRYTVPVNKGKRKWISD